VPEELDIEVLWFPKVGWIARVEWEGDPIEEIDLWDYIGPGCQCLSLESLKRHVATSTDYDSACENVQDWHDNWVVYVGRLA
jgi:hypothetical protein